MAVVDGDTKAVADQTEQHLNKDTSHFKVETFISGGIAGCVAKSLVAPIDRVKILLQVHNIHYEGYGIFESFVQVVQKEGFMSLYKGNGVQLIRIFPYAALQFSSYETYKSINKKIFKKNADNLLNGVVCGSMAGITAVTFTYPLDVIRSRLAFQFKGKEVYFGIIDSMRKIYNEKGSLTSFYRGYYITILGMIPYAGLSFSSYDRIKHLVLKNKIKILTAESPFAGEYDSTYSSSTQNSTNKKYFELTVIGKLVCGGMTGALTQTVTYPIDVIRRHMQLVTMIKDSSLNENTGILDTAKYVYNKYGIVRGFYRGISLNYIRAVPMVATSFCIYEISKKYLGLDTGVKVLS